MRITGLATGLDVDSIVEQTMSAYRTKIDQQAQKKDISEIKQKLYTDIMKDSKDFYNKHFDILKSDSLFSSSNWQNVKFTSSSSIVKVTGNSEAKSENYKITGSIATAASKTIDEPLSAGSKILVNGKEFTLAGTSSKNISDFNAELKAAGINVSARYNSFTGSNTPKLILESTELGSGNKFSVDLVSSIPDTNITNGEDATFTKAGLGANLDKLTGVISINNIEIDLTSVSSNEEKFQLIKSELSDNGANVELVKNNKNYELVSTVSGSAGIINLTPEISEYITIGEDAIFAKVDLGINLNGLTGKIAFNNININLDSNLNDDEKFTRINTELLANNSNMELLKNNNKYELVSKVEGKAGIVEINSVKNSYESSDGVNALIIIEDSKGGVYTHTGASNTFTVDGVTFDFKGKIETDETINISGETNTDAVKEKIINLFNDYNTLMEKLNTLTTEKKNKGYDPLTKEQRSELSEEEVKLWDAKVQQGQLYKDSDLTRITNSLKSAMRTMVSGTGLNLEQIGITPVADYGGTKNGTFVIDETKLSKALETNLDDIKNMFVSVKPSEGTDSQKYGSTGIMYRIKDIIYSETMISTSALSKKAGLLGTATATDNTLSKVIKAYERKMEDMEVLFLRKEQLLYSQYAKLETAMNNYNAQQSSLSQAFGTTS